jgi:hypothetical protein
VNPIDWLLGVVDKLRRVDRDDAALLEAVVRRHINSGDSIDHGLGLSGDLGRSPRFNYSRRERKHHISEALRCVNGDYKELAAEIYRYRACYFDAWRPRPEPAPEWAPVRASIHLAFRTNINIPRSISGLRKVVSENTEPPSVPCFVEVR